MEAQERVEGVSRVVDYIRRLISQNRMLAGIRVRGEVSGFNAKNGHLHFYLKEDKDLLKCIVWASDAPKLPPFKDGDELICGGQFGTYSARSEYQLFVKSIELTGTGALYAQFEALKERFRQEGLFEEERKRPMPAFPRRIAVVSAEGGRGVEDFFNVLAAAAPFIEVSHVSTRVQGDGAEIDIGEAIDRASRLDVDVIVLTRGGGSYEDLFPFNREAVVRAIVRAKHPVLSAVGHTADIHLSDLVADHTCITPTQAANYFADIGKRYAGRLGEARTRMQHAVRALVIARSQTFAYAHGRLEASARDALARRERSLYALERRLEALTPQQRLAQRGAVLTALRSRLQSAASYFAKPRAQRLLQASERLGRIAPGALRTQREQWTRLATRLGDLSPETLLERGYAIVMLDGKPVRNAQEVPVNSLVTAKVAHGTLAARVERNDLDG